VKFIEKLKNDRCSPFSENFSENLFSENDAYPMQGAVQATDEYSCQKDLKTVGC